MPTLSRFYGIVVMMFWEGEGKHHGPHFHAYHSGREVSVRITDLAVLAGGLAPRAQGMLMEWATLHRAELLTNWELAKADQPLVRIDPLA